MASVVKSFAIVGVNAYLVEAEIKTIHGQPLISIVGLGDMAAKEAKERPEAALNHKNFHFPKMKVAINLAPSDMKKVVPTLEVTKIYSVTGLLRERGHLITRRPFRAPHHNASTNSLIGGGRDISESRTTIAG